MARMVKAALLLLLCCAPALAQLPDAPPPTAHDGAFPCSPCAPSILPYWTYPPTPTAPIVHFYTVRTSWQAPQLRTNKEVFKSKVFVGSHALAFTAMGLACADRRTGESLHSELPAMLAVTGLDYLMFRFVSGFHGLIGSSYASQRYLRARVK